MSKKGRGGCARQGPSISTGEGGEAGGPATAQVGSESGEEEGKEGGQGLLRPLGGRGACPGASTVTRCPPADTCYVLSFSVIMLNTSLHNPNVRDRPPFERFVAMNRGINGGSDLPEEQLRVRGVGGPTGLLPGCLLQRAVPQAVDHVGKDHQREGGLERVFSRWW